MKKILVLLLILCMALPFVACGGESPSEESPASSEASVQSTNTDTNTDAETDSASGEEEWEPVHVVDNLFLAGDQYNQEVVLYNLDGLEAGDDLEYGEEWKYKVGVSHVAGLKYREDTVFGDVILIAAGATKGQAQMVSYPEGKLLWSTKEAGNNPHCIEILPSGNIVVASSTGSTLRLFRTAALLEEDAETAATYEDTDLYSAHGVLWDPKYNVLWGLGENELAAYTVEGEGIDEALTVNEEHGYRLPASQKSGHALCADLINPDRLYFSVGSVVLQYDKVSGEVITNFDGYNKVSKQNVKGLSHNQNGNFCLAIPNGGKGTKWENISYGSWDTDTLIFCYYKTENMFYAQPFKSADGRAFYKVISFYGKYQ